MNHTCVPVMVVYGTRPEAIKLAPVIRALEESMQLRPVVVVTGQHREMLDQVNQVFGISPDVDLNIMNPGQSLNRIAARILHTIDAEIVRYQPAAIVVQGDTTTVMAAAVAAFNRSIPVVHLEAGLRSGDLSSPFPEEGNRKLVSQISALNLAPTVTARNNLLADGVEDETIKVTGNTVIDALQWAVGRPIEFRDPTLSMLECDQRPMILLTAHRRENLGNRMEGIGAAVAEIARQNPNLVVVWPAHKNPQVRRAIEPHVKDLENVHSIEPIGYHEFSHLLRRAHIVLTDSGGLQEEAPSLGKPVLILRDNTERPEAIDAGTAKLIGTDPDHVIAEVQRLLDDPREYRRMAEAINPFGDGQSAIRCVEAIQTLVQGQPLGTSSRQQSSEAYRAPVTDGDSRTIRRREHS